MPDTGQSALDRAVGAVPAEQFHGADGRAVRPCTPASVTLRHLRMLDVRPGANVMDIGIGSGLSAALLAQLVGPEGHVVAVEVVPELAARAEALYAEHGHRVSVVVGDGLLGHPAGAPFDRIMVGTTPPAVPDAWLQQLRPGGVLLCGVRVSPLPNAYAVARITVDDKHQPDSVEIHHGGYTPMILEETPGLGATATVQQATDPGHPDHSLSVLGAQEPHTANSLLAALTRSPHVAPSPVPGPDYFHLKNWLLAVAPAGLLDATVEQGTGIGTGFLTADGRARAAVITDDLLIADSPDSPALGALLSRIADWREAGEPRTHDLPAHLHREGDAWYARLSVGAGGAVAGRPGPGVGGGSRIG